MKKVVAIMLSINLMILSTAQVMAAGVNSPVSRSGGGLAEPNIVMLKSGAISGRASGGPAVQDERGKSASAPPASVKPPGSGANAGSSGAGTYYRSTPGDGAGAAYNPPPSVPGGANGSGGPSAPAPTGPIYQGQVGDWNTYSIGTTGTASSSYELGYDKAVDIVKNAAKAYKDSDKKNGAAEVSASSAKTKANKGTDGIMASSVVTGYIVFGGQYFGYQRYWTINGHGLLVYSFTDMYTGQTSAKTIDITSKSLANDIRDNPKDYFGD